MIKAVIFDVDGVLIDSTIANTKFYHNLFDFFGYQIPNDSDLQSMFNLSMMDIIRTISKLSDENEIQRIWEYGKDHKNEIYPLDLLTYPVNIDRVIEKLSKKYILGIVTSRVRGGIYMIPELAKLKQYFKNEIYFEDTVKHKPDPEPLILSATRLNVLSEEAVYIGDMESDAQAAKSAGMKIIIYSKNNLSGADGLTSDFTQLPRLIENI